MFLTLILINLEGVDLSVADILGIVGVVVAFIVGLGGLIKAFKEIWYNGWTPTKQKVKDWWNRRKVRTDLLNSMQATLDRIDSELRTNGGASLKDVVNSTAVVVQKIQARIDHKDEYDPQPVFHLDANGEMCFANLSFREMLDAEEQDLFHSNYLSRVASLAERQMLDGEISNAIAKRMPFDVTVTFRLGAGRTLTVRLLASPNVLSGKELRGFIGTAKEVQS